LRNPPRLLIADDNPTNVEVLRVRLAAQGYEIITAADGEEALTRARQDEPDLILLDIMMPKRDGISVLKELKADSNSRFIPVVLVTARADTRDVVAGLEAGGDDYLTKPIEQATLVARVRSLLRIKELHDTVTAQAAQLATWNTALEQRVADQVGEIERMSRLQRFLPPQVAKIIASSAEGEQYLASHRREITVLFCDLRGFTAFTDNAEPEEVMSVLREYHESVGALIFKFEGTLERFLGDGIMIIFNDPIPCADHTARGARLALEMREEVGKVLQAWHRKGHTLGFGIGIASDYATLGQIGFEQRRDYTAIGRVTNLASRLCDQAKAGQIVISQRALSAIESSVEARSVGELTLKGFGRPVPAYEIVRWLGESS
jgi:class 3 adenylate cyclase/CheY-like chemotaxis protein